MPARMLPSIHVEINKIVRCRPERRGRQGRPERSSEGSILGNIEYTRQYGRHAMIPGLWGNIKGPLVLMNNQHD